MEDADVNGCDLSDDADSIFDTEDNEPVKAESNLPAGVRALHPGKMYCPTIVEMV